MPGRTLPTLPSIAPSALEQRNNSCTVSTASANVARKQPLGVSNRAHDAELLEGKVERLIEATVSLCVWAFASGNQHRRLMSFQRRERESTARQSCCRRLEFTAPASIAHTVTIPSRTLPFESRLPGVWSSQMGRRPSKSICFFLISCAIFPERLLPTQATFLRSPCAVNPLGQTESISATPSTSPLLNLARGDSKLTTRFNWK